MKSKDRVRVAWTDSAHRVPSGARGRIVAIDKAAASSGEDIIFVRFSYTAIPGVYHDSFLQSQVIAQ